MMMMMMMVGLLVNLAQKERKRVCSAFSLLNSAVYSGKCGPFKVKQAGCPMGANTGLLTCCAKFNPQMKKPPLQTLY